MTHDEWMACVAEQRNIQSNVGAFLVGWLHDSPETAVQRQRARWAAAQEEIARLLGVLDEEAGP